jgi:hypothetical protein
MPLADLPVAVIVKVVVVQLEIATLKGVSLKTGLKSRAQL